MIRGEGGKESRESRNQIVVGIEVLNLNPADKKAIILLLYHTDIKVLKGAPAC
jgi:hypothetical protein